MSRNLSISSIFFKIKFLKYFFNSMDFIWINSNFINLSFVLRLVPLTKGRHFLLFQKADFLFDWFYALYFVLCFINYLTFGLLWWCHIKEMNLPISVTETRASLVWSVSFFPSVPICSCCVCHTDGTASYCWTRYARGIRSLWLKLFSRVLKRKYFTGPNNMQNC